MCCYGAGLGEGKGGIVGNKVGIGGWFTNVNVLVWGGGGICIFCNASAPIEPPPTSIGLSMRRLICQL